MEKERTALKGRLAQAEDTVKQLESRVQHAEARATRHESTAFEAQAELSNVKAQLEAVNARQETLSKDDAEADKSATLQRTLVQQEAEVKAALQQVKDLSTRLEAAVQGHAEAEV